MTDSSMTREQFHLRFKTRMRRRVGHTLALGGSVAAYVEAVAPMYWTDAKCAASGPEACADAHMDYWRIREEQK